MFRRTVTLRNRTDTAGDVYSQAGEALRQALVTFLPGCAEALTNWPDCEWSQGRDVLKTSAWTAEASAQTRLLTVEVQVEKSGRLWALELLVGATGADEAAIQEVCRLEPAPAQFPLHEMPNLLAFCEHYACYDVDGMRTGAAYMVQKARATELRTFLQRPSDERRLPIVLVTPNNERTFPLDYRKLAQLLCGVAHVMVLYPQNDWKKADVSAVHGCPGGAVRLYRPGYAARDAAAVHPCFQPQEGQIAGPDKLELLDKIVAFLAAAGEDPLFAQLARRRQEEQAERQVQQRLRAWQEQAAQDQQQSGLTDEFFAEYDRLQAERDALKRDLDASLDEVRRLRFAIQQSRIPPEAPAAAKGCDESYVTLSDRAADTLQELDGSERELVTATLLRKLASDPLRKNQSEVCPLGERGTFYIYPRKHTNGGRRIIYLLHGPEVRICEIYASHDAYTHARKKGWSEADYQETRIWFDEGEGSTQLEMVLQP